MFLGEKMITGKAQPEITHPNSRIAMRQTEGSQQTGAVSRTRNLAGAKRRGRPPGSKTRPKSSIPTALVEQVLEKFNGVIPPEHFEYLKSVIKGGASVSIERELDILILLLGRNLHPALVAEMLGEEEPDIDPDTGEILGTKTKVTFRRDVTDRLKVLNSILTLRHQVEKGKDEGRTANSRL